LSIRALAGFIKSSSMWRIKDNKNVIDLVSRSMTRTHSPCSYKWEYK
jgi:hypothetical protein